MKRSTILTVLIIILTITSTFVIFLPTARAVTVAITSLTPATGEVGTTVALVGTINKTDGQFRIWFANQMVKEANASGYSVNTNFKVPALPRATYFVTLQDVYNNVNATEPFLIKSAFNIRAILMPVPPEQIQENTSVNIQVNVTGGSANTAYHANITVNAPYPSNETYWALVTLTNTTTTGNGSATVIYPNNFIGASRTPHTNYTGTYNIALNKTLATNSFKIGLTNATEYHRRQIVGIKAAGYKPNENAIIKVTSEGKTIDPIINVNATEEGLILADWPVPVNASIGTYTVNITSTWLPPNATRKNPPDIQSFTVPGFNIVVTTENLAQETVQGVAVKIFENAKSIVNATSNSNGSITVTLDVGNYTFQAFYKGGQVYDHILTITNAIPLVLDCNLTNLKILVIAVKDGINIKVPGVKIYLTRENKTLTTDINGTTIAHSLLPNVNYTLNASRYDVSFNVTTLSSLLVNQNVTAWYNVTLTLSTWTLRVNATNANGIPIPNAMVKARELMGGLIYENNTNTAGIATISKCAFGEYDVTVYDSNGIELKETEIAVFSNQNKTIICELWGLTLSIQVLDYFGQPISNVNVTLRQNDLAARSQLTQSNGAATFSSITGGNMQIIVYLSDRTQPYMAEGFFVSSSMTIGIKLDKYVMLVGLLVETSSLITAILIIASVILVLSVEVYRRKRSKPLKKPELEPE